MANVVVIDDEPAVCDILQTVLENAGHRVRTSTSAKNLQELLSMQPEIVLLDVLMPEINGLECLPQIMAYSPKSQVVVITGVDDYRIADLFYEAGAHSFLTKPIRHENLLETIQRILDEPTETQSPEIDF